MHIHNFSRHSLAAFLALACSLHQSSCRSDDKAQEPKSEVSTSSYPVPKKEIDPEAESLEMGRQSELEALKLSATKELDLDKYWKEAPYSSVPSRIFMPKSNDKAPGARYLTGISIAIFEQALAGKVSGDLAHYDNSLALLKKIVETDLNFSNDPALKHCAGDNDSVDCVNDNRTLAAGWALSAMARGARILDLAAPKEWQSRVNWVEFKSEFISWFEKTSKNKDNPKIKPWATLIQHPGTLNWVSPTDSRGSTNRSFAVLEAQMRMAEFRGGQMLPGRHMKDVFADFKRYLSNYFTKEEKCKGDPKTGEGKNLDCLANKDEARNDTYHPLMGLASIGYILEIGQRNGLQVDEKERAQILKGYHWGADWNTPRMSPTDQKPREHGIFPPNEINSGIDVWETAFRLYSVEEMGPLCRRDRDRNRSSATHKKAGLAWGYGILADGF